MKLLTALIASILIIAFGCYRKAAEVAPVPSPVPDTLKPRHLIPYDSVSIFSYFVHKGDMNPNWTKLNFKTKKCYEYHSEFGYKPCDSSWVIKDTMKLIKAMLYDLAEYNRMTFSLPPAIDTLTSEQINRLMQIKLMPDTTPFGKSKVLIKPDPSPAPDTIPRPKYEYYYKFQNPINRVDAAYDTIRRFVLPVIGNRMFKDESEYYQVLLMNQINIIIGRPTVDSVKIELPKK